MHEAKRMVFGVQRYTKACTFCLMLLLPFSILNSVVGFSQFFHHKSGLPRSSSCLGLFVAIILTMLSIMLLSSALCDGEINAVVEGSKFRESHVLKILS
jgi:hypothetical protein